MYFFGSDSVQSGLGLWVSHYQYYDTSYTVIYNNSNKAIRILVTAKLSSRQRVLSVTVKLYA